MRSPLVFSDVSVKPSFLRTTPARKPRTECCCHPVAFMIAAMVVPVGDCSIAMTCDCLETGSAFLPEGLAAACCEGLAAAQGAPVNEVEASFQAFALRFLRSV